MWSWYQAYDVPKLTLMFPVRIGAGTHVPTVFTAKTEQQKKSVAGVSTAATPQAVGLALELE